MICPKCGEVNSDNFRFCGMCGTLLEARVEARRPAGAPVPNLPKIASAPEPLSLPDVENAPKSAQKAIPPISGPSMLGLNQLGATRPAAHQPSQASMDSLREKSFSGLDSFFEPEEPKTGGRRILLLVVLLAALGGSGWWLYANYLSPAENPRQTATSIAAEGPAEKPSTQPTAQNTAPAADASSSQAGSTAASVPEGASQNPSAAPEPTPKTTGPQAEPETKPTIPRTTPKIEVGEKVSPIKSAAKRESGAPMAKASKPPEPAAAGTGDADFRKGEAYLYGRGAHENCDEAVKYLKAASAKSNAKARSAFGTMYATGHCVPRDLPTSYLWFAMALRVDPNNQILEKDLSAIWNQMTPPERQMATRMKQ